MECDINRKHTLSFTGHKAVEIRRSSKKKFPLVGKLLYFQSFCTLHQTHPRLYIYFNIHVNVRIIYTLKKLVLYMQSPTGTSL